MELSKSTEFLWGRRGMNERQGNEGNRKRLGERRRFFVFFRG
jgi:hypothetical protein